MLISLAHPAILPSQAHRSEKRWSRRATTFRIRAHLRHTLSLVNWALRMVYCDHLLASEGRLRRASNVVIHARDAIPQPRRARNISGASHPSKQTEEALCHLGRREDETAQNLLPEMVFPALLPISSTECRTCQSFLSCRAVGPDKMPDLIPDGACAPP